MLWTIFIILLVLWALGLVTSYTMGGFIHLLLVGAGCAGDPTPSRTQGRLTCRTRSDYFISAIFFFLNSSYWRLSSGSLGDG